MPNTGEFTGVVHLFDDVRKGRYTYTRIVLFKEGDYPDYVEINVGKSYDGPEPQIGDEVTAEFYIGGSKWEKEDGTVMFFNKLNLKGLRINSQNRNTGRQEKATGPGDFGNPKAMANRPDEDIPF